MSQLVTAYRKAKVDLFYSSDPRRLELVAYEENLANNLERLLSLIKGDDESWAWDHEFLGDFTFAPKRMGDLPEADGTFWSDPARSWEQQTRRKGSRPVAEMRLMSRCSVDLHVFSTLWMIEVGTLLDRTLPNTAYGNRLRIGPDGGPNQLGLGSFLPYQSSYQHWRDAGLAAMTRALAEGREVIALTADVTAFYHRLEPDFLEDDAFLAGVLGVALDAELTKLNRLFVASLRGWAALVAAATGWRQRGLPVGLPASAVVANLALAELDEVAERLHPLSYGRYVDDVLLVVDAVDDHVDQRRLWPWLIKNSDGLLAFGSGGNGAEASEPAIHFVPPYLEGSLVAFANSKNKTFHLSGSTGATMIDSIRATLRARTSEWRAMTTLPDDVEAIGPSIAAVLRRDGAEATTLRDADRVSTRKQSFSLRLRDLGTYERNLPPEEWAEQREEFFRAVCDHVLTLPAFVELASYLPRLVALAAASEDHASLGRLVGAVARLARDVPRTCTVRVAAFGPDVDAGEYTADPAAELVVERWQRHLIEVVLDGMASGWRSRILAADLRELLSPLAQLDIGQDPMPSASGLRARHRRMAQRDLAHRPYRWSLLQMPGSEEIVPAQIDDVPIDASVSAAAGLLVAALRASRRGGGRPPRDLALPGDENAGIVFRTRPPTMMELHQALGSRNRHRYGIAPRRVVSRILLGLRGQYSAATPGVRSREGWPTVIDVPVWHDAAVRRIGLAMLDLDENMAEAAALGTPDLTRARLDGLRHFLGAVAEHDARPDYLVLPELALPARWFPELARGLQRSGISLISGIEHQPSGRATVANQVWAALQVPGPGQRHALVQQDKQRPARREAALLAKHKKTLVPSQPWAVPPVIAHGEFRFAMLVCSELTNIANRAHLRGAVDALVVPEWNQDVHWFEALLESATLDLHTYFAQANTRGYGDTRIRAPMRDAFARDVVRLQGGAHDYVVIGDINVDWLRRFQTADTAGASIATPPGARAFKPTPDGFGIDPERRRT